MSDSTATKVFVVVVFLLSLASLALAVATHVELVEKHNTNRAHELVTVNAITNGIITAVIISGLISCAYCGSCSRE